MVASLSLVSCSNNVSLPTITQNPGGSGGSYSITYGTPEILAAIAKQSSVVNAASVMLETDTMAVTNAAITLSGGGVSLPVTFNYSTAVGSNYAAYYYSINNWSYQGNTSYTMTVSYGGHTFSSTITSVGNVTFSPSGSAITIAWAGGGNENTLSALSISPSSHSYTYGPNITSPYVIPQSGLANYTGGNYTIQMNANETLASAFSGGAYLGSSFTSSDQESTTY